MPNMTITMSYSIDVPREYMDQLNTIRERMDEEFPQEVTVVIVEKGDDDDVEYSVDMLTATMDGSNTTWQFADAPYSVI